MGRYFFLLFWDRADRRPLMKPDAVLGAVQLPAPGLVYYGRPGASPPVLRLLPAPRSSNAPLGCREPVGPLLFEIRGVSSPQARMPGHLPRVMQRPPAARVTFVRAAAWGTLSQGGQDRRTKPGLRTAGRTARTRGRPRAPRGGLRSPASTRVLPTVRLGTGNAQVTPDAHASTSHITNVASWPLSEIPGTRVLLCLSPSSHTGPGAGD